MKNQQISKNGWSGKSRAAMSITKKFPGNDDRRNSNAFLKKLFTPRSHKICFSFVNVFSAAAGHQIAAGPMGPIFYQLSLTGQNVKFCEYDC